MIAGLGVYDCRLLQVLTKQDLPIQWAATQHGLGNAYSERIKGNRAANLEKSIQCYTRALEVLTK
jgi:Tetratricopeptide repeat